MKRVFASAGLAVFLLVAPLVAGAAPGDRFNAAITPDAVRTGIGEYTISITNVPASPDNATHATVAIPAGFEIDAAANPPQASVSGCADASPWLVLLTPGSFTLDAPAGAPLCPGGTLALTFTVLAAPPDGAYEWTTAVGSPGDFEAKSEPRLTIDGTPPETTIDSSPELTGPTASFAFTGTDVGSGVEAYECSLDGSAFEACASPKTYNGLTDGRHTFDVRARDAVGPDLTPAHVEWTVDATPPPSPVITSAPSNPSGASSWTFQYTDGDASAHFWCQLDGGGFTSCPSGFETPVLADGAHTFGVKALDDVGNASPVTSYAWTIDTIHPLVTVTDAPPLLTNQTSASFSFAANKQGSTYECALDGGEFAACTSPRLYTGLGNGSHTFSVRATRLGIVGPVSKYTWTIDIVPPQTTISSGPPATSRSASATFAFSSSEAESTFACRLDGGGFTPCTSPKTYAGLGDGKHTFAVQAVDRAGNADPSSAAYSWQISGVGPATQDLRPPGRVSRVKRSVGYGRLQLRWQNPRDEDFDHVNVVVSTKRGAPPRTLVYSGRRQSYTNRRFKNGLYYRYLIVSVDRAENPSKGMPATVPPSVLLRSPRDGRVVHAPPLLRWTPVRKATFYNVQVFHAGTKMLSAWPTKPRRVLARRWTYGGHRFFLRRGLYVWYVWPGFGPKAHSRYGQLLGRGTFRVR